MTVLFKKGRSSVWRRRRIPEEFFVVCSRLGIPTTQWVLVVYVPEQRMDVFEKEQFVRDRFSTPLDSFLAAGRIYRYMKTVTVSTSRFGTGQLDGSFQTPLGLHRIAKKFGAGFPQGTVFKSRNAVGFTWKTHPEATIVHRIMWLEGLEPGVNRGDNVDSFKRYIYIHGFYDETTLGRPASCGCIHVAADDLIPLFDTLPEGTLVFITQKHF